MHLQCCKCYLKLKLHLKYGLTNNNEVYHDEALTKSKVVCANHWTPKLPEETCLQVDKTSNFSRNYPDPKKKVASKYKQMLFQTIEVKWQQNEERKEETNKVKMYIINKHEKEEIA